MDIKSLHALVHSLSGSEKRHFGLYLSRHKAPENNLGLQLFKDLEAWRGEPNEFEARHRTKKYVRQFRFHRHRLYREILRSLHLFHRSSSMQESLREEMHTISLMITKGLFSSALKRVQKAKAKAAEFQLTVLEYELVKQEADLAREMNFAGYSLEKLQALHKEMKRLLNRLQKESDMETRSAEIYLQVSRDGLIRKANVQHRYQQELENIEKAEENTFRGKFLSAQTALFMQMVKEDYPKAKRESERMLGLFTSYPHMKREMGRAYLISLHNHSVVLNNLKVYQDLPAVFRAMYDVKLDGAQIKSRYFYSYYNLRLTTFCDLGEFETAAEILHQMREKLRKGENNFLNRQHEITHAFSGLMCNIGLQRWKEAHRFCRLILTGEDPGGRTDVQHMTLYLRALVLFESNRYDTLEMVISQMEEYVRKQKNPSRFDRYMLDFFKHSATRAFSERDKLLAYESLRAKMHPLASTEEKNYFSLFDLLTWLDCRVEKRSFAEALRSQAMKHGWNEDIRAALLRPVGF